MYKNFFVFLFLSVNCIAANAAVTDVEIALRATYNNCVGIESSLRDMKIKAGIGTAVTGVGIGLGIGATAVGIAKSKTDALIEEKFKMLEILSYEASSDVETMDEQEWLEKFRNSSESDAELVASDLSGKNKETDEIRELTEKSKKLGHWRTGLLVGNTATNITGAAISGINKVDFTLSEQIQNCKSAVQNLQKAIAQAKIENIDVGEAVAIESACKGFEYIDADNIDKINRRAKGGMISSVVGTGTGVVGVITSALANSDKIRNDDSNNGKKKEKNLNTAANVMAVSSTLASTTATVFNASQMKAIKDIVSVSEKCTEALR